MAKFVIGPAMATIAMPACGLRKLRGITGIGLAQPKMKLDPK